MKTRITMICHGATADNRMAVFPANEPLEARAIERTPQLRRGLSHADRVLVSPALRAVQTAELLGLPAVGTPELRECDYGRWTGQPIQAISEQDPAGLALWMSDFQTAPHGGEPMGNLLLRTAGWLEENLDQGGHTIAITHASIIRACILHAMQAPAASFWKIDVEPLSLTELSSDGRRWSLRLPAVKNSV